MAQQESEMEQWNAEWSGNGSKSNWIIKLWAPFALSFRILHFVFGLRQQA